jgi:hypothetical protein
MLLPIAEFTHNSWKHEMLGKSPHKLILGYNPTVHIDLPKDENVPAAIDRLTSLEEARRHTQTMMEKRPMNMRLITTFTEGEEVWLEGKNLNLAMGTKKLAPKRYGPFKILKKISSIAY